MSCRSSTTWICDQCGKEAGEGPGSSYPRDWIDLIPELGYVPEYEYERDHKDLDFCSWGCCARYCFKRSEGV